MKEPPIVITFIVAQIFGLLAAICMVLGAIMDIDVTEVDSTKDPVIYRFVWHPVVMSIGLVYIFGCSIVVYRVLMCIDKPIKKIMHASIHYVAVALALFGLILAIQTKNALNYSHFTSLHGLFGLCTVILFCLQWVISFLVFLWPKAPDKIRAPGVVIHALIGIAVFLGALITTISGINSKRGSSSASDVVYKASGFLYFFYVLVILFMVSMKEYKVLPRHESTHKQVEPKRSTVVETAEG
ncbi:hypothetical protein GE061_006209 [Apolygus lucorum]|uniref:Cytochrome b561 domain-containing protein n=1 Tax=Apolygus lucorum TaxID=248454 RepID=A0A8S9WUY0_APOLU|nr:hypothetical protein GE061_006209 [Apolygus lucorum]